MGLYKTWSTRCKFWPERDMHLSSIALSYKWRRMGLYKNLKHHALCGVNSGQNVTHTFLASYCCKYNYDNEILLLWGWNCIYTSHDIPFYTGVRVHLSVYIIHRYMKFPTTGIHHFLNGWNAWSKQTHFVTSPFWATDSPLWGYM